ncbi:hypothetical protein HAX54_017193 [Datura stramonium]|uniref:Uncharacterized protein n=1 Tax=Datura stramonium TaxID=4076 RepID=A0ABS8S077_DATST|nr:hypothetical protein [Datura stramonium]
MMRNSSKFLKLNKFLQLQSGFKAKITGYLFDGKESNPVDGKESSPEQSVVEICDDTISETSNGNDDSSSDSSEKELEQLEGLSSFMNQILHKIGLVSIDSNEFQDSTWDEFKKISELLPVLLEGDSHFDGDNFLNSFERIGKVDNDTVIKSFLDADEET